VTDTDISGTNWW